MLVRVPSRPASAFSVRDEQLRQLTGQLTVQRIVLLFGQTAPGKLP